MFRSVRNYIMFDVPINYVADLGNDSGQYINMPPVKRLFDFSLYQLASPFVQFEWNGAAYNEFNPIIALIKSSMFDEGSFFENSAVLQLFCRALLLAGFVTAAVLIIRRYAQKICVTVYR